AIRSMPRFVYFFCGPHRSRPEALSNRARGVLVATWTGGSPRAYRRRKAIQFDRRRAVPRTGPTNREHESNRKLVETHARGSFGPSVGPAYAGPPVETETRSLCFFVAPC